MTKLDKQNILAVAALWFMAKIDENYSEEEKLVLIYWKSYSKDGINEILKEAENWDKFKSIVKFH